jgi:uncharacterized membrane protein YraQ (UPF0718 family)/copper chaperone CopZ
MAPYIVLGLIFVGLLNLFVTKDMVSRHMGKNNFLSILKAALFGVPLPLCSCGVIPSSVYMYKNGASKSAVVSFLISTPQTGIDSIIATYGMLGWVFAIFRPIAAFAMGILGGVAVRIFDKEKPGDGSRGQYIKVEEYTSPVKESKLRKFFYYPFVEFLDDISTQFIVGVFIAGLITYLIPDDFFAGTGITEGVFGMLIMIAIGIPMYVCATASIPIAIALMMKGFSPGTAFAFLAAGPATNAASLSILVKTIGKKTTTIFVGTIALLSLVFGLLLDKIFELTALDPHSMMMHGSHNHDDGLIPYELKITVSIVFLILLLMSVYRKYLSSLFRKKEKIMETQNVVKLSIEGMTCNHCVMNVKKAIEKVDGTSNVNVVLQDNAAYFDGTADVEKVKLSIEDVGYKVV